MMGMTFLSSGFFYLVTGFVLLLLSLTLGESKPVRSLSALLFLIGGFNVFVDKQATASPPFLVGAAILIVVVFAIAYTYFCASVLEYIGLRTRWQVTVGAYLPLIYGLLLITLLLWYIESSITQRGLTLYILVVFALCIHLPLLLFTISRTFRKPDSIVTLLEAKSIIPCWFCVSIVLLVLLATIIEFFGRKDWTLLSLNLLTTGLLAVPFITIRLKSNTR